MISATKTNEERDFPQDHSNLEGIDLTSNDEGRIEHFSKLNRTTLVEIGRLRIAAWEASGPRPTMAPTTGDIWIDDHDEHANHWVLRDHGQIVAAARLCVHASCGELADHEFFALYEDAVLCPVASMSRLVIHPDFRRQGLPALFDLARLDVAIQLGAKTVVACTPRRSRVNDLERSGFKVRGGTLSSISGGPDTVLLKTLA